MKNILLTIIMLSSVMMSSCNNSNKSDKTEKDTSSGKSEKTKPNEPDGEVIMAVPQDTTGNIHPMPRELDFLRDMNGKYPGAVKLFDKTAFTERLRKLLGERYTFLKKTWAVENPIEVKNDIFVAWGCEAHNCGSTNFIIVVDLAKDKMYAGVREEEKVKTYTEDNNVPAELQKWANGN